MTRKEKGPERKPRPFHMDVSGNQPTISVPENQ